MEKRRGKTIAITSGKGGVGKSSIVTNMAYIFGKKEESTYIVDADLSLGNIDIFFGMIPKFNIKDLIEGKKDINEIIIEGPYGIKIIPATSGIVELSNLTEEQRNILMFSLQELTGYDFLLVDTPAGISSNVVYFNSISHDIIVVVTPDPASIADSYAVIKVLHSKTGRKDFNIIVNMVRDEAEALNVYRKLLSVSDQFLNVYLDFMGYIPMDANIRQATKRQKLWVEHFPDTQATKALLKICNKMVS
ncbi:MAG TPA: MinD/ParA family protein [Syntrophorhabdaceae bacterium]|nr:MinD/ParA family protein [Syntrophorhabdaceae bacterium]HOT41938.1 MinD/ParA family protein [Syntrophorhabdaceae bacterium]HPC67046.1 MinD/ParA family protein [Syntrophorhabdaceae bacterium]HPP05726.1 MinD/ParA family protein [Syntrophorhabdaceae bacterium]HQE79871.1 MinD/ParA family protein [Syntrophorhabdaceae bacterium]